VAAKEEKRANESYLKFNGVRPLCARTGRSITFLRSGHDLSRKQCVSTREKISAYFRIGTSLVLLRLSSWFSWIA
jgi:hypothetical protein